MCGVFGWLTAGERPDRRVVEQALGLIAHRGPDGAGVWDENGLALGHRRLSIVDLSDAGLQPMHYRGRWVISYNGEVFNFVELRRELEALGHQFVSHSDTEVLLGAFDQWGIEAVHRFNGMFAILLFDRAERRLYAIRDRFGVKPLYYWTAPGGDVVFASEIKQFTAMPGWRAKVNPQRAYDFLAWALMDHTQETIFDGVMQVPPGHLVELPVGQGGWQNVLPRRWYSLSPRPFQGSLPEAAQAFRDLFVDAVRLRLRADVPVGSCLSGGLDSSSVVCAIDLLLDHDGADQRTYSACSHVEQVDERRHIDQVVAHTGVRGRYTYPDIESLFELLPTMLWHQDEPFCSTSIFAQWNVFELAAQDGVKVMLDGQGADEQLAGYHSFFGPHLLGLLRSGRLGSFVSEMAAMRSMHQYPFRWFAERLAQHALPKSMRQVIRRGLGYQHSSPNWIDMSRLKASPVDPLQAIGARASSTRDFSEALLSGGNLQMLLHWEDRDSMAHSVEARVPFLDYRLVEFVLGLPDDFKIREGTTKFVMREAMRGLLPESIRVRQDKIGFATPEEVWMRQSAPQAFRKALDEAIDCAGGVLTRHARHELESVLNGSRPFSFLPWRMICFGNWVRRFDVTV